ncbi:MAG: hypothetical protein JO272_12560 [Pseudonocardiales bacterium]|nr:hypothetical protein [Pseudonocardiales bacterium]
MATDPSEAPYIRDIPAGEIRTGSTRGEAFRAVMRLRTPQGEIATVIVTRQVLDSGSWVWLTFSGAITTTAVMTDGETGTMRELLSKATGGG